MSSVRAPLLVSSAGDHPNLQMSVPSPPGGQTPGAVRGVLPPPEYLMQGGPIEDVCVESDVSSESSAIIHTPPAESKTPEPAKERGSAACPLLDTSVTASRHYADVLKVLQDHCPEEVFSEEELCTIACGLCQPDRVGFWPLDKLQEFVAMASPNGRVFDPANTANWRVLGLLSRMTMKFIHPDKVAFHLVLHKTSSLRRADFETDATLLRELSSQCGQMPLEGAHMGLLDGRFLLRALELEVGHTTWRERLEAQRNILHPDKGTRVDMAHPHLVDATEHFGDLIEELIDQTNDMDLQMTGLQLGTLGRSYLMKLGKKSIETVGHLYMRQTLMLVWERHREWDAFCEVFRLLRSRKIQLSSPMQSNLGWLGASGTSCFLDSLEDDSLQGIINLVARSCKESQAGGGVGFAINHLRGNGAWIQGTNGHSDGAIRMLKFINGACEYVNQGGGKRKGAFAAYVSVFYTTCMKAIRANCDDTKPSEQLDIRIGLIVTDLFMERMRAGKKWTLLPPECAPELADLWGQELTDAYLAAEKRLTEQNHPRLQTIDIDDFLTYLAACESASAGPYVIHLGKANYLSAQKHAGKICTFNLCTEIAQYSGPGLPDPVTGERLHEVATCNLAQLVLGNFVCVDEQTNRRWFDWDGLASAARVAFRLIDMAIDVSVAPTPEVHRGMHNWRNAALGFCGMRGAIAQLRLPVDSTAGLQHAMGMSEVIAWASHMESAILAKQHAGCVAFHETAYKSDLENIDGALAAAEKTLQKTLDALAVPMDPKGGKHKVDARAILEYADMVADLKKQRQDIVDDWKRMPKGPEGFRGAYPSFEGSRHHLALQDYMAGVPKDKATPLFVHEMRTPAQRELHDRLRLPEVAEICDWELVRAAALRYGFRNCTKNASMPTATTAILAGQTPSSEAPSGIVQTHQMMGGERNGVFPGFMEAAAEFGIDPVKAIQLVDANKGRITVWEDVVDSNGEVVDRKQCVLPGIPADLAAIYQSSYDTPHEIHTTYVAAMNHYADQPASLSLAIPGERLSKTTTLVSLLKAHLLRCWDLGLSTYIYYVRIGQMTKARDVNELEAKLENADNSSTNTESAGNDGSSRGGNGDADSGESGQVCRRTGNAYDGDCLACQ